MLAAAFLIFPLFPKGEGRHVRIIDWLLIALTFASVYYFCTHLEATKMRATAPLAIEIWLGGALILLVLEATRRATGWALPLIAICFLIYGYFGRYMPEPFNHRGFSISRIVGQNYLTLEGLFSTPMDVAATFIIVFSLYGAVLDRGGAGKFYHRLGLRAVRQEAGAGSTRPRGGCVRLSPGHGLGLGSRDDRDARLARLADAQALRLSMRRPRAGSLPLPASAPRCRRRRWGRPPSSSPNISRSSYLDVLVMATIPTVLYYLCCWLMVEADARRLNVKPVKTSDQPLWQLTVAQGYHFLSLAAIAVLLIYGMSAFLAVFWSIVIAIVLSMIRPEQRLLTLPGAAAGDWWRRSARLLLGYRLSVAAFLGLIAGGLVSIALYYWEKQKGRVPDEATERMTSAIVEGGKGCVGIAATCATAGIIVSIINLSGLGLKLSGLIVDLGGGSLPVTILLAAFAMWILGTAIPVTASYIIAAVILVPALVSLGVPQPAAHMFMFYYAVLADVSPPTALAPFAASAICGGSPFRTMMQAWKYTLPAFVVPVMFCLSPDGMGLLLSGSIMQIVLITLTSAAALAGFCIGAAGWILGPAHLVERLTAVLGGIALIVPDQRWQAAGAILIAGVVAIHVWRFRKLQALPPSA